MVASSNLSWQGLKERQCTLKGQARYVNVWGSVHWKGVYKVRDKDVLDQVHKLLFVGKFIHLIQVTFTFIVTAS